MCILRFGSSLLLACRLDLTPALAAGAYTLTGRPILRRTVGCIRSFATGKEEQKAESSAQVDQGSAEAAKPAGGDDASADASATPEPSTEELMSMLKGKEDQAAKMTQQVEALTDSLKRTLADMENLRARTAREVEVSKKFAIQGFVKALLDVPDNLERAVGVVPPESLKEGGDMSPEKLRSLLSGLVEGVRATESILLKVLKQHGVQRYDPSGQLFDPNLHSALFDIPDPTKENNTIAIVMKKGYKLNDRVIRPAEVGVVRNATS